MDRQQIIKDSSIYSISAAIGGILSALQAILIARLLTPELYGTFHVYRLVWAYIGYSTFGTFWAMMREISFHRGRNDYDRVSDTINASFSFNISTSTLSAIVVLFLFLFWRRTHTVSIVEICFVCLLVIAQRVDAFCAQYFLAQKRFNPRSILAIIFPLANIIFILIFGPIFKLQGILFAMLVAYSATIIYSAKNGALKVHFSLPFGEIKNLIKKGLPVLGNGLLTTMMLTLDRLMIIRFLGKVQLGYYGLASMLTSFMETLYNAVFMTIFPRLTEKYGQKNNINDIKHYVLKPMAISAHLSPVFFGGAIILIPLIITYILPKYVSAIVPVQIVITASFFGCLQAGIVNFFIALNKIYKLYPFRIISIIAGAILMCMVIKAGLGIKGIAFGFVSMYAVFTTMLIRYFLKQYAIGRASRLKFFVYVYYPYFYMILSLLIVFFIFRSEAVSLRYDILQAGRRFLLFSILNIPLFIVINKKTAVLSEIKKMFVRQS